MTDESLADEVRSFWFDDQAGVQAYRAIWFASTPAFDAALAERFGAAYERAAGGQLDCLADRPGSCLALVLLLDQIPRNLFRGTARAFATDVRACDWSKLALERGFEASMTALERFFLYMPFQHSEQLPDQERALSLFATLAGTEVPERCQDDARRHYEAIRRFGRFPHRNGVLGRATSEAEQAYLDSPEGAYWR